MITEDVDPKWNSYTYAFFTGWCSTGMPFFVGVGAFLCIGISLSTKTIPSPNSVTQIYPTYQVSSFPLSMLCQIIFPVYCNMFNMETLLINDV
jgi:hypothetical protein